MGPIQEQTAVETKKVKSNMTNQDDPVEDMPSVYDFTNYREYLNRFFERKKEINPAYSASLFARKARLGKNSRGYLKLVIDNKRNLSPQTIRSFSEAIGLTANESIYFENLVLFNQADRNEDRQYYLARMMSSNRNQGSEQLELLKSQYACVNNWYYMAVREIVALKDFQEDPAWIANRLRGKVKKEQVIEAIRHLMNLGLLTRNPETGQLTQTDSLVKIKGGVFDHSIQNYHLQMIERAKDALMEDPYEARQSSGVILSCPVERLPEIGKMVEKFRDQITEKFGVDSEDANSVLQLSIHLFQLTKPKLPGESNR